MNAALSIQQKADLQIIEKMPMCKFKFGKDEKQQASLEILNGKELRIALIYANFEARRMVKSCGFESLDEEDENGESLYNKIAKNDDEIVDWRLDALDICSEQLLDFVRNGGAAVGRAMKLTGRSGQLKVVELIKRVKSENDVKKGGRGQFGLDFGGI
jgi:hypothetical protein